MSDHTPIHPKITAETYDEQEVLATRLSGAMLFLCFLIQSQQQPPDFTHNQIRKSIKPFTTKEGQTCD